MMHYSPKVVPVELFPGDYCLLCVDPAHEGRTCHMLEVHELEDGAVDIGPCGCENSVTAGAPGRYVLRVMQLQKE